MEIPVIDFSECSLSKIKDSDVEEESYFKAGSELYRAFAEVGFAYVINSGISKKVIEEMSSFSDTFFSLPKKEKLKFYDNKMTGIIYDPEGSTKMYKDRPSEIVESLRIMPKSDDTWPEISGLKETTLHFQDLCKNLTLRLLKALGRGMKLKDSDSFNKGHKKLNMEGNATLFKLSLYPAITGEVEKGAFRFAEHTDLGSLTLLFHEEDGIHGLQAELTNGQYVDIKQVPNAILLTVGDEFRFWTGGRLRSVKHRVIVPENVELRIKVRKSMAYFAVVDDEVLLEELEFEDSNKKLVTSKSSMTGKTYINMRFDEVFD